ncbi:hypothetical protein BX600DRAFT_459176 [Xylariales sp. PMI_506]|nr:hypothetical protein BX600DRAFT_459176 [Xylariales sp. PMI_506]
MPRKTSKSQKPGAPVRTSYRSREVSIPEKFLKSPPADAQPITVQEVRFEDTVLPEYQGHYAVVLDNVLSPSECAQLIQLAESSVMDEDRAEDGDPWRPALVNVGPGLEAHIPDYRNSDRIIWDQQEIVDRLWARMADTPIIKDKLGSFKEIELIGSRDALSLRKSRRKHIRWDFHRVNQRLRFLKYGPGQFFSPHCDGSYDELAPDGTYLETQLTVHLYLNDSKAEAGDAAELVGGATSFLSLDEKRKLDINPKAGRVLIFQHHGLYHSGDDVKAGTKYTVRTDIMYKYVNMEE